MYNPTVIQGTAPSAQQAPTSIGIVIIDHGSRREESNALFSEMVSWFRANSEFTIVEEAHMEIATPDLQTAMRSCVEQGATTVIIHPYFLAPGRHVSEDIPKIAKEAAADFPQLNCIVTAPIADHPLMFRVMDDRVTEAISYSTSEAE